MFLVLRIEPSNHPLIRTCCLVVARIRLAADMSSDHGFQSIRSPLCMAVFEPRGVVSTMIATVLPLSHTIRERQVPVQSLASLGMASFVDSPPLLALALELSTFTL